MRLTKTKIKPLDRKLLAGRRNFEKYRLLGFRKTLLSMSTSPFLTDDEREICWELSLSVTQLLVDWEPSLIREDK